MALCLPALAQQQLKLPQPSPISSVTQEVGVSEIAIDYSSPAVKGRKVWGELVPYNVVWRTGANAATRISFSHDFTLNGQPVKAGAYSFFIIPAADKWTLILNKDTDLWGADGYKKENDVLRWESSPKTLENAWERLTYTIAVQSDNEAEISLWWEKMSVSFRVSFATQALVKENLKRITDDMDRKWLILAQGAEYMVDSGQLEDARKCIDESLNQKPNHYYNQMIKARIQAAEKDYAGAVETAQLSINTGNNSPTEAFRQYYKAMIQADIEKWRAEMAKTEANPETPKQ